MCTNVVFVTFLCDFSTKKEANRSTLVELFTSFFLGFTDVFSKLSVNQFIKIGSAAVPLPDT